MSKFNIERFFADRGLPPEERRAVLEDLFVFGKKNQVPFRFRMAVLLVLSTIIATAGLISDSSAVVIGAMLVAPLMNPVMAAAGAVVMGWSGRFYGSLWLVSMMGLGAMLLSSLITFLAPDLVFIPEQVLARTRPTFYDLIIALAAGSAGAYTITRKESSAIPGVAVAVALLPPLASSGILLTSGHHELALRALVLFVVNLIAMILAGALTFMAVGVSPTTTRRKTAAFARSQIMLFVGLTAAISIPLWFYSEDVIFNAHYRAAKSKIVQNWLKESELELVDVEILRDQSVVYMSLVGPTPPVNMDALYKQLNEAHPFNERDGFTIEYTWSQKITGVWPPKAGSIEDMAELAHAGVAALAENSWIWTSTQYDADATASAEAGDQYVLSFTETGTFRISAQCGSWQGSYSYGGEALSIETKRNLFSGCRKDPVLKLFREDLERARAAYVRDDRLIVTMANGAGTMYFDKH